MASVHLISRANIHTERESNQKEKKSFFGFALVRRSSLPPRVSLNEPRFFSPFFSAALFCYPNLNGWLSPLSIRSILMNKLFFFSFFCSFPPGWSGWGKTKERKGAMHVRHSPTTRKGNRSESDDITDDERATADLLCILPWERPFLAIPAHFIFFSLNENGGQISLLQRPCQ